MFILVSFRYDLPTSTSCRFTSCKPMYDFLPSWEWDVPFSTNTYDMKFIKENKKHSLVSVTQFQLYTFSVKSGANFYGCCDLTEKVYLTYLLA